MSTQTADSPLIRESFDVYHENAKRNLTSHQLADYRRCPLLHHKKQLGLIEDEDRPAYLVGRAAHTLILEGRDAFEAQYAVGGPVNPKTGQLYGSNTKAFAQWAAEQGKPVLTLGQFDTIENMAESVEQHELAQSLLSDGIPEGVVRAEYCGLPCQIRMDSFDPHQGIVELKTCDDLDWFEADARRYGYVYQVAFYQAVLSQVIGLYEPVYLLGVEKKEPFRCGVWKVHEDVLAQARRENETAIERLRECMAADTWPSGYEESRVFDCV